VGILSVVAGLVNEIIELGERRVTLLGSRFKRD
jgi:hypothetical protein